MKRHLAYLKYVLRHKWFVFLACLEYRVPLWIAISHDWDKFLPDEWFPYARCFYKPNGEKQYNESVEFSRAWMLHQHRNKHHWQYWLFVTITSHNCGMPLPETDYMVWDRGEVNRVVKRNSGGVEWYELQDVYPGDFMDATPMPDVYQREMLADWVGAGRAITGKDEPWIWYGNNKEKMNLHPDTRHWIETALEARRKDAARRTILGI